MAIKARRSPRAHQVLPSRWEDREHLRKKGQFWTPDWVAAAMVAYVLGKPTTSLLDPAVGEGVFFRAAISATRRRKTSLRLEGFDVDERMIRDTRARFSGQELRLEERDFVLNPPDKKFPAIVANPPYIRHHRLTQEYKSELAAFAQRTIGTTLDGRVGLQTYFLIRALSVLEKHGRLAFIVPADVFEGISATLVWKWISEHFCIRAIVTFAAEATPFPGVDTNAVVVFIDADTPKQVYVWAHCERAMTADFEEWVKRGLRCGRVASLVAEARDLGDWIPVGIHRQKVFPRKYCLGDFADVRRGIATGANEFFLLSEPKRVRLGIGDAFVKPAIARTRSAKSELFGHEDWQSLRDQGEPVWLMDVGSEPMDKLPKRVAEYLRVGEKLGIPSRALVAARRPWYKMEKRVPPPFLFAYLGRRNSRFIRNSAEVVPLTGFLCVYPKSSEKAYVEKLWLMLNQDDLTARLRSIGKTYGGGAVKVEPRALERLPLVDEVPDGMSVDPAQQPLIPRMGDGEGPGSKQVHASSIR